MVLIHKIGLDIDNELNPIKTELKMAKYKSNIVSYKIYISAGGKGLHFEILLKKPLNIGESFKMREKLGDDPKRLIFSKADFERGWDFDILFTYKKVMNDKREWIWKKRRFIMEIIL